MLLFLGCLVALFWLDVSLEPAVNVHKIADSTVCKEDCCMTKHEEVTFICKEAIEDPEDLIAPVAQW